MNNLKNLTSLMVLSASLTLGGCDEKAQTVEWYKTHEKERKATMAKCNSELKETPNCINAREADIAARENEAKRKIRKPIF